MRVVLQRVKSASVTVDEKLISSIGKGVLIFAGISKDDTPNDVESMAGKVLKTRLWDDDTGEKKWKRSVQDIGGEILCVSQFTLLASTKKATPDFHKSAAGEKAKELYSTFFSKVKEMYEPEKVKDGIFAAMMDVALINDGPVGIDYNCEDNVVTLQIDTAPPKMDIPGMEEVNMDDLGKNMEKITKEFQIPAELLE